MRFSAFKTFVTNHEIKQNGKTIKYTATVEKTNIYTDDKDEPAAYMYSYYYKKDTDEKNRPVIFGYNGGPGSGSLWVNLGFLGPRRAVVDNPVHPTVTPPFALEDNPFSPIDYADIIILDMVGCGYSRLLKDDKAEFFYGADADAATTALYIEYMLNKYSLFNSPKYLFGESYGTFRNCLVSHELTGGSKCNGGHMVGIQVDGIINIGTFIYGKRPDFDPFWDFYGNSCTHWYHLKGNKPSLDKWKEEVWHFMGHEYRTALFYDEVYEKREAVAKKLEKYSGISASYYLTHGLLCPTDYFILNEGKGKYDIGYYDGRFTMKHVESREPRELIANDAAMAMYTPLFVGSMDLLKHELEIEESESYKSITLDINSKWKRDSKLSSQECLTDAMRRNESLRVLFQAGLYDLCTQPGLTKKLITHSNLDLARVTYKEYESGHMIYIGDEPSKAMADDLKDFILKR